ncbi:hypothetical protein [Corynebacterium timonense]|uniref:Uncharacterized protein n=1 Tax=Corynebacterium timonense TaxID=441500 RepID=A0A1H1M4V7_9CORY|nr:hypothetical protein [Corynebacterium timonense]SDR81823.1 hypothetical protein SAMN04488539_0436 [Corynebacterium timonense]
MNQILDALKATAPTASDVMNHSVTFSPRRWKTGWPHHLRRVPPFRDDATATLTRAEVFLFAGAVVDSGFQREQIIDFLGATLAYGAGQSPDVLLLQQFLRNKGKATALLQAIRGLEGAEPAEQYAALTGTGLRPKYASLVAYFLAGPQEAGDDKPVIICSKRAAVAGLPADHDWSGEEYGEYLTRLRAARDEYDSGLAVDAVEFAARQFAD